METLSEVDQIVACAFPSWYNRFRTGPRDKHTFKSVIIPISHEFIAYLKEDGIKLPIPPNGDYNALKGRDPRKPTTASKDDDSDWGSGDDNDEEITASFPELENSIVNAITELEGEVFPKLNWTSPRDAGWMGGGTLACGTPGEIFLLLKSSDLCRHDFGLLDKTNSDPVLVLRKFVHVNPAMEFRCLVKDGRLAFVCQRDTSRFYEFLEDLETRNNILSSTSAFYNETVSTRLGELGLATYAFDIYIEITSRRPRGKCWLVDIAPLLPSGEIPPHPLVTWKELIESTGCTFKWIKDRFSVEVSESKVMAMNRVPMELIEGSLTSEAMQEAFDRFRRVTVSEE